MSRASRCPAFGPCALVAVLSLLVGCESHPGSPIPPDTGDIFSEPDADPDAAPFDGASRDGAADSALLDIGYYEAPPTDGGNCVVFPATGPENAVQCDPGTTCDVSGPEPLCARHDDGGIPCGVISCIGYGCSQQRCVGFYD